MNKEQLHEQGNLSFAKALTKFPSLRIIVNSSDSPGHSVDYVNKSITIDTNYCDIRGLVDSSLSCLLYHDQDIDGKYRFQSDLEREVFSALELVRCNYLASSLLVGIRANIQDKFNIFLKELLKNCDEISAITAIINNSICNFPVDVPTLNLINKKFPNISKVVNKYLDSLKNNIHSQDEYAQISTQIIQDLTNSGKKNQIPNNEESEEVGNQQLEPEKGNDNVDETEVAQESETKEVKEGVDIGKSEVPKESIMLASGQDLHYDIYTTHFDEIIKANLLVNTMEFQSLKQEFLLKLKKLSKVSTYDTSKLIRKIVAKKLNRKNFDLEDGLLDIRKFTSVIVNPQYKMYRYNEVQDKIHNTAISILLDNSGSMRGRPILITAMSAWILGNILAKFDVNFEVLGFTTARWQGGNSRKIWEESSNSAGNTGRLNDVRHIIYKEFNSSWNKSKNNLAVMLKDSILKENIDGEALIWAAKRLNAQVANNKILLVVSDGTPVDDSTLSVNPKNYLDNHLHHVISLIEKKSKIKLLAIGIGHDVGNYYKNSIVLNNVEDLTKNMISNIADNI